MKEDTLVGYLEVFVRTAGGSLPVEGARVLVSREGVESTVRFTNESGMTERMTLPAPALSESEAAGGKTPFYEYRVEVTRDGFYRQITERVPIFPGVIARQPINLIGLSEFDSDVLYPSEDLFTVRSDPQSLTNGREDA